MRPRSSERPCPYPGPGALVVGGDYQGLGVVRSLGRRGVPVCVLDDERSIAPYSAYTSHAVRVPSLRDEEQAVSTVLDVTRRLGLEGWVLFPTRDETVASFSRHRCLLSGQLRVPTPGLDAVRWTNDKRNTYHLARELGIPVPRTWHLSSAHELGGIDGELPLTIKPAIKERFFYATKAKAWRADSYDQLCALFDRAAALVGPAEVMVQEFIPGDGAHQFAYCAFFKEGQTLGRMVVRRTRQHPVQFGRASTFVQTLDLPVLDDLSERFLKAIGYYGLVELEYKLDRRDGEYKLLDVNARTWGYHSLGQRAGVDFPFLVYADQLGESVEPCRATPGVGWIRLTTDLPTALLEVLRGRLGWRDYLSSLKEVDVEAVFERDDVLPGVVEIALLPYLLVKRGF